MAKLEGERKSLGRASYEEIVHDHEWRAATIVLSILLTALLIILGAYTFVEAVRVRQEFDQLRSLVTRLHQDLLTADENISNVTQAYIRDPDEMWLTQRVNFVANFDAALTSLQKVDNDCLRRLADQISSSSQALSRYEIAAIKLADEGQTTAALDLLNSASYVREKARLRSAMALLDDDNAPHLSSYRVRLESAYGVALFSGVGVIVISSITWGSLLLRLIRWRRALVALLEERTKMAEALRESEERYVLALAGANDGIWDWDLRQDRVIFSSRWKWLLGYEDHEIGSSPAEWFSRVHSGDRDAFQQAIRDHLDGKSHFLDIELRMVTRQGEWRWMHVRGVAVLDNKRRPVRMAGSMSDITRRKVAEEQLRHGAFHDPLTQLPNRTYFMNLLERAVARVKRHPNQEFALLFLDLDNFKEVNDHFGHTAGDECLLQIATRLARSLRPSDVVARVGGDEFLVLIEDVETPQHVYELAHRIEEVIRQPLTVEDTQVSVGVSVGVAFSSEPFSEPTDLIALADAKMYEVKASRKSQI